MKFLENFPKYELIYALEHLNYLVTLNCGHYIDSYD